MMNDMGKGFYVSGAENGFVLRGYDYTKDTGFVRVFESVERLAAYIRSNARDLCDPNTKHTPVNWNQK